MKAEKPNPKALLKESLKDAYTDDTIDWNTINFSPLNRIVEEDLYGLGINWAMFWSVYSVACFRLLRFDNPKEPLSTQLRDEIVDEVNKRLSNTPYTYYFYFLLPSDFAVKDLKINEAISIFTTDEVFVDEIEKKNPPDQLEIILGRTSKKENHRILAKGTYFRIEDKGLLISGKQALLEANYSPDRLLGIYLGLLLTYGGLISTKNYTRHIFDAKVYDAEKKYVGNFRSPWHADEAVQLKIEPDSVGVSECTDAFNALVSPLEDKDLERARVQICNSMYWISEYLNAEEINLKIVFACSIIDSLFPPRLNASKQKHYASAPEKSTTIADLVSIGENDRKKIANHIDKLYEQRNEIIHGLKEIHGYSGEAIHEKDSKIKDTDYCFDVIQNYINIRISKFTIDVLPPVKLK